MIAFWISAALVSAAAATLIIQRAARAARVGARQDPTMAVYRRQLAEIDELAERGLLADEERRSAHAEAARRLLAAADATVAATDTGRGGRLAILAVAALAPLAAIGVYLIVGSPQTPDQPFARRLSAWRAADPASLVPEQLVAVLQLIVRERPNDPQGYYFLARAQMACGDPFSATHSLQHAIDLAPRRADFWTALGEIDVAQAGGEATPDALNAFRQAARVDPAAPAPRYYLARARIAGGDVAGGLVDWKALDQTLATNDPRRQGLEQEIAVVERTHALPRAADTSRDPRVFIRGMVETLATRLKARPDDPAGWARLIRSYAVLGDEPRRAAALAAARDLFKSRPADLRLVEQAASKPQ